MTLRLSPPLWEETRRLWSPACGLQHHLDNGRYKKDACPFLTWHTPLL